MKKDRCITHYHIEDIRNILTQNTVETTTFSKKDLQVIINLILK